MKKIGLGILVLACSVSMFTFASVPTSGDLKAFSSKLDTHKTTLLKNLTTSQNKLRKISNQNNEFSTTSLFKGALCLGVLSGESQHLDYSLLINDLKTSILDQYIKLDGDIKRIQFGLSSVDALIFGNSLDTFYNQNALKITNLENDYYTKTTKVKDSFLEYIKNNKDLLVSLANKMEAMEKIDKAVSGANLAFSGLNKEIAIQTKIWKTMGESRATMASALENQLTQTMNEILVQEHPSGAIQAKFLIHKQNFLKKFDLESQKAEYALFASAFDYAWYLQLLANYKDLHKTFDTATGSLNCPILLTSSVNFAPYLRDIDAHATGFEQGVKNITAALHSGKFNLTVMDKAILENFTEKLGKLNKELTTDFKLMLLSELPKKEEKSESSTGDTSLPQQTSPAVVAPQKTQVAQLPAPVQSNKVVFTQAFKKGAYAPEVQSLQALLKQWGLYQGAINGVYDKATIEAVYQFQLKYGILTGREKNKSGYGWFGVQTRAKVNALQ